MIEIEEIHIYVYKKQHNLLFDIIFIILHILFILIINQSYTINLYIIKIILVVNSSYLYI